MRVRPVVDPDSPLTWRGRALLPPASPLLGLPSQLLLPSMLHVPPVSIVSARLLITLCASTMASSSSGNNVAGNLNNILPNTPSLSISSNASTSNEKSLVVVLLVVVWRRHKRAEVYFGDERRMWRKRAPTWGGVPRWV